MRYFSLFALAALFVGCGAAASQIQPEEPVLDAPADPLQILHKSECLEVTAPPGWRITKAETVRPTPQQVAAGEDVFSGLVLANSENQEITIVYPHNGPAVADGMFMSALMSVIMTKGFVADEPEQALVEGIAEYDLSELIEFEGYPNSLYFMVRMVEVAADGGRPVSLAWFASFQINPADENTVIYFNTTVMPVGTETISGEVVDVVRTLRLTCTE